MKVLGCAISIVGILLCVASVALFGLTISRAMEARPVQTLPLEMGNKLNSDVITVDTSKLCMIALKAKVTSTSARRQTGSEDKYDLQFSFPFRYRVVDEDGKVLVTEDTRFADDTGTRSFRDQHVTSNGGTVEVETGYEKFPVTSPGKIRVEAEIHLDETDPATAEGLNLIVYDRVSKHAKSVTAGVLLLVLGGGLAILGGVLFIVGSTRSPKAPPAPPS